MALRIPNSAMVFVALGSNQGNSVELIARAIEGLEAHSSGAVLESSLWAASPVDCAPGAPAFLNAVVGLVPRADDTPESFLHQLKEMEREFGRRPKRVLNEARPLDLDLIAL